MIKANLLRYRRLERNVMYTNEIHIFSNFEHSRETTFSIFGNNDFDSSAKCHVTNYPSNKFHVGIAILFPSKLHN